jgi:hypothetical protein
VRPPVIASPARTSASIVESRVVADMNPPCPGVV